VRVLKKVNAGLQTTKKQDSVKKLSRSVLWYTPQLRQSISKKKFLFLTFKTPSSPE